MTLVALDVADEVDQRRPRPRGRQARVGLDARAGVPLRRLLAVREQADARALDPEHALGQRGAHERELDEVLGADLGVGADVEQRDRAPGTGTGIASAGRWMPRARA